jgi:hypothetical protein
VDLTAAASHNLPGAVIIICKECIKFVVAPSQPLGTLAYFYLPEHVPDYYKVFASSFIREFNNFRTVTLQTAASAVLFFKHRS